MALDPVAPPQPTRRSNTVWRKVGSRPNSNRSSLGHVDPLPPAQVLARERWPSTGGWLGRTLEHERTTGLAVTRSQVHQLIGARITLVSCSTTTTVLPRCAAVPQDADEAVGVAWMQARTLVRQARTACSPTACHRQSSGSPARSRHPTAIGWGDRASDSRGRRRPGSRRTRADLVQRDRQRINAACRVWPGDRLNERRQASRIVRR